MSIVQMVSLRHGPGLAPPWLPDKGYCEPLFTSLQCSDGAREVEIHPSTHRAGPWHEMNLQHALDVSGVRQRFIPVGGYQRPEPRLGTGIAGDEANQHLARMCSWWLNFLVLIVDPAPLKPKEDLSSISVRAGGGPELAVRVLKLSVEWMGHLALGLQEERGAAGLVLLTSQGAQSVVIQLTSYVLLPPIQRDGSGGSLYFFLDIITSFRQCAGGFDFTWKV